MEPIGVIKTGCEINGLTECEMRLYLYKMSLVMASVTFILSSMATVVGCISKVMNVDTIERHEHLFITTVMNIDLQS